MRSRSLMSAFHLDQENAIAELTSAIWRYSRYSAAAFYDSAKQHTRINRDSGWWGRGDVDVVVASGGHLQRTVLCPVQIFVSVKNKMQPETTDFAPGAATRWTARNISVVFDYGPFAPLCENVTSSTKPEVHSEGLLHCRQRMTEQRPQVMYRKCGSCCFDRRLSVCLRAE